MISEESAYRTLSVGRPGRQVLGTSCLPSTRTFETLWAFWLSACGGGSVGPSLRHENSLFRST